MKRKRIVTTITEFLHWIGALYTALRVKLHVLVLQRLVVQVAKDLLSLALPYSVSSLQMRVIIRRIHDRKYALFSGCPDSPNRLPGTGRAMYRNTKPASEVCYKTSITNSINQSFLR